MAKKYEMDMIHGHLGRNILRFAFPMMLSDLIMIFFNVADTVIVGKFAGEIALAAVGATGSIVFFLTALFSGLASGVNVIIANTIGSGQEDEVSKAVHTSIALALLSGILLLIVGELLGKQLLMMMHTPQSIIEGSSLYLQIYFAGGIGMLIYDFGAAILRSCGDSQRPFYYLLVSSIINIVLNLVFVIIFKMSVAGVAIATVVSQWFSALLILLALVREDGYMHLNLKKLAIQPKIVLEIMKVGIPAGIQAIVFALSNLFIQSSLNSFNSATIIAANTASMNIEDFVYIGTYSFSMACMTFTSQNYGAKNYEAIPKILKITLLDSLIGGVLIGASTLFFGKYLLYFYTNEIAVIEMGMIRFKYVTIFLFVNGILDIFSYSMRGMQYTILPTVLMILGICGIRIAWLKIAFGLYPTLPVLYMCYPVSWFLTTIIQFVLWVYVFKKKVKPMLQL